MIFKRSIIVNKLSFRLIIYTATIPRLTPSLSFPNSSLLLIILRPPCLSSTLSFVPLLPCPSSACLCHFVSSSLASSSNYPSSPRLLVSLCRSCLCVSDPCIYSPSCTLTLIRSCIVDCAYSYLVSCFLISLLPVAPSSLRPLIPLPLVLSSSPPIPSWTPRHFPSASVRTPTI